MTITELEVEDYARYSESLFSRFESATPADAREIEYRKNVFSEIITKLREKKLTVDRDRFLQKTHEIESFLFLQSRGEVRLSSDHCGEAGADMLFNNDIYVECVCSSPGDAEKSGLMKYLGLVGSFDYNEKSRLLNARFTSSLCEKANFYYKHQGKSIDAKKPYVVFLSPGMLKYGYFEEDYGMALTDILVGRGNPSITISNATGEIIRSGYTHVETFEKWNGSKITSNLFLCPYFRCVSGVLFSVGGTESYTTDNTFLYLNPYATNPVDPLLFGDVAYWKASPSREYQPFRNGRLITD